MTGTQGGPRRELHELLAAVHGALQDAGTVGSEDRRLLEHLVGDIRAMLDAGAPPGSAGHLRERLRAAVTTLETSHPQLSKAIANVIDALAFYNL